MIWNIRSLDHSPRIPASLMIGHLAAFHKAEIEKWWPIIKAAGIRAE
jgi:hypothetical protein